MKRTKMIITALISLLLSFTFVLSGYADIGDKKTVTRQGKGPMIFFKLDEEISFCFSPRHLAPESGTEYYEVEIATDYRALLDDVFVNIEKMGYEKNELLYQVTQQVVFFKLNPEKNYRGMTKKFLGEEAVQMFDALSCETDETGYLVDYTYYQNLDPNYQTLAIVKVKKQSDTIAEGYLTYQIENGVATIIDCDNSVTGDFEIPSEINGYPVVAIGHNAFDVCKNLLSIKIPDGITSIDYAAFAGCISLERLSIPESVNFIGKGAFQTGHSLKEIVVDPDNQYFSCDENGVLFNKDKTLLIRYPSASNHKNYTIPDSVKEIESRAFWISLNLESVTIPENVSAINSLAFENCSNLVEVIIYSAAGYIGEDVFNDCYGLNDVYYIGTEDEWNMLSINDKNDELKNANIYFCSAPPQTVMFDYGYDGITVSNRVVPGKKITLPETQHRIGYEFVGWTPDVPDVMPEEDLKFTAIFNKVVNHSSGNVELSFNENSFEQSCNNILIQNEVPDDIKAELKASSLGHNLAFLRIAPVNDSGEKLKVRPGQSVTVRIKVSESEINADVLEKLNNNNPDDDPGISVSHITTDPDYKRLTRYTGNQVKYENGYIIFDVSHFSYFLVCIESDEPTVETKIPTLKIRNNPGVATVNYGDTLWLTADVTDLPEGCEVWWFFEDGTAISGTEVGTMVKKDDTVTVKILDSEGNSLKDENGNEISDTQEIKVKDTLWLRIVSFFKNLFRIDRFIVQSLF